MPLAKQAASSEGQGGKNRQRETERTHATSGPLFAPWQHTIRCDAKA